MKLSIDHALIQTCAEAFAAHPTYAPADEAINKLVRGAPRNDNLSDVLPKVATIKTLYAIQMYNAFKMAEHIVSIEQLDALLKGGSIDAVDKIRKGHGIRKKESPNDINFYSFATKYCSFHNPAAYPIYDSIVGGLIKELTPGRVKLGDYSSYKWAIDQVREKYSIHIESYKILDMGLWIYAKLVRTDLRRDERERDFFGELKKRLETIGNG